MADEQHTNELQTRLDQLRHALNQMLGQLGANSALTPEIIEQMAAPLRQQITDLEGQILAGQAPPANTTHITFNHAKGIIIGDDGNLTMSSTGSPTPLDDATALSRYLAHVIAANRSLQLQGIRSASSLVSIDLEQIYITLTTSVLRTQAAEDALVDEMTRTAPGEAARALRLQQREPQTAQVNVRAQEALALHRRLVVIGDPGCGKTTLLRYLALTYARDLASDKGLVKQRLQLDEHSLPILMPLRDFAGHLQHHHADASLDGPRVLLDYLREYFSNQYIILPAGFFEDRLIRGECIVLLDGVDEVADPAMRNRVARNVDAFTRAYPDNRYVVTSRIVGYTGSARLVEDYALTTVRDFTSADVERFVSYWNRAVEAALAGGESDYTRQVASDRTDALLSALRDNERIRELAVNPLLLTVVALVQRYRAELPERRTELYEEAIEVLLGNWDAAKGLKENALVAGREIDAGDRRGLLAPIALWMMEQRVREIEVDELRRQLVLGYGNMYGEEREARKAVDRFLQLIGERSGLLQERGQGIFSFSHLTFQEYLAAQAVVDRSDYIDYTLSMLGEGWWREVVLLEAGYLSTQGKKRVTALVKAIMDCTKENEPYYNLVLAAECIRDVGPARLVGDMAGEVQRRIRREFEQPLRNADNYINRNGKYTLTELIRRRSVAAEALGRIESGSGTQPAFWRLPFGEPVWVDVPAGEFWMGSEHGDDGEKPVHRVHLERYQIARVPITNAQYLFFVQSKKHVAPKSWVDGRPPRGKESHPVVDVSWHDAMAYCAWLAEVTGKSITLPSEAQWEKAARGNADQREYPWGDEWDETRCNCDELGIGDTTPVSIFPEGASPFGCLDMAGNVWEWTNSIYKPYPYHAEDGRENRAGDASRVLRGGSFDLRFYVYCACRRRLHPGYDDGDGGFRIVVSPISPRSAPSAGSGQAL